VRRFALATTVLLLAGACRSEGLTLLSEPELPQDVYGSPRPTPVETPEEIPLESTVYLVRGDRLQPRLQPKVRPLQPTADSLPEALMLALIQPPAGRRVTTAIPPDTRLNGVPVLGQVATVDLSSEFERPAPGPSQALRIAQVVYTLTQEGTGVIAVQFAIDGIPRLVIGGVRLTVLPRPVTRADYRQFAPPEERS
jgi:spore germination protein GerM